MAIGEKTDLVYQRISRVLRSINRTHVVCVGIQVVELDISLTKISFVEIGRLPRQARRLHDFCKRSVRSRVGLIHVTTDMVRCVPTLTCHLIDRIECSSLAHVVLLLIIDKSLAIV